MRYLRLERPSRWRAPAPAPSGAPCGRGWRWHRRRGGVTCIAAAWHTSNALRARLVLRPASARVWIDDAAGCQRSARPRAAEPWCLLAVALVISARRDSPRHVRPCRARVNARHPWQRQGRAAATERTPTAAGAAWCAGGGVAGRGDPVGKAARAARGTRRCGRWCR